jgi:hypothetical protein
VKRIVLLGYGLLFAAVQGFPASPVATVSSSGPFELRGNIVPVSGVPAWPVMAGDEIGTANSPSRLQFTDGSVATLAPKSHAKVEKGPKGQLVLRLVTGAMVVTVPALATLAVFSGHSPLVLQPGVATSTSVNSAPVVSTTTTSGSGCQPFTTRPGPPAPVSVR